MRMMTIEPNRNPFICIASGEHFAETEVLVCVGDAAAARDIAARFLRAAEAIERDPMADGDVILRGASVLG